MYQVNYMLNIYCWVFLKVLVAVVDNYGRVIVPKVLVAFVVIFVGMVAIVGLAAEVGLVAVVAIVGQVAVIDIHVELVAVVGLFPVVVISSASMRKYQQKFDYV